MLRTIRDNLRLARFNVHEVAGSLGDLGTFLPLLVAMSATNHLDFAAALFFAGLFNIITGMLFPIPMAVQPMKAIAAVALAQGLTAPQIVAAGASVSAIVLVLGLVGGAAAIERLIPRPAVRGLQLALGVTLIVKAVALIAAAGGFVGYDSATITACAAALVGVGLIWRRLPVALVLFVCGIGLAVASSPDAAKAVRAGLWLPSWSPPAWADFEKSFVPAALPQIPLTLLNSVVAVCALSVELFPDRPAKTPSVARSVGVMNIVGACFGAMPMCHGAGGLAGQHRFGARTNGSVLMLGGAKVVLAVVFGGSLISLCAAFPKSILGVMLIVSAASLMHAAIKHAGKAGAVTMLVTAAASVATGHMVLGLAVGLLFALLCRVPVLSVLDRGIPLPRWWPRPTEATSRSAPPA